ncbi:MAG: 30S ribosomal protein S13 [Bacteroidales bacterium]|nr:30S ribosomal protein S13 [Bacteroidales bacterium]
MARIAGVDIPKNKSGEIALTYIYGIGRALAQKILDEAEVERIKKVQEWDDDEQTRIRNVISNNLKVEGELRSEIQMNIKRLMDIGTYRGISHRLGLSLRGHSIKNSARSRKGRK